MTIETSVRLTFVLLTACVLASACGPSKEEKLEEKARVLAKSGQYEQAIAVLEPIANQAGSADAVRAKKQIILYRGFMEADVKRARRQAKDEMLAIARALLDGQSRNSFYPASLEELDPNGSLPHVDPWQRPYKYERSSDRKGYRLECLGRDGVPGGDGDDRDLLFLNGEVVKDLNWEDQ